MKWERIRLTNSPQMTTSVSIHCGVTLISSLLNFFGKLPKGINSQISKSTNLRDVFQLSSHILSRAYIAAWASFAQKWGTTLILAKISKNYNASIEQMYLEKKEAGNTDSIISTNFQNK
jgi:hypothetical protein